MGFCSGDIVWILARGDFVLGGILSGGDIGGRILSGGIMSTLRDLLLDERANICLIIYVPTCELYDYSRTNLRKLAYTKWGVRQRRDVLG